jgi:hypothetical protein
LEVAGSRQNEHREYVGCIVEEETPRWKKNIMRLELGMFGLRSDAAFNA